MNTSIMKKNLVVGIILLFFSIAIPPGINANMLIPDDVTSGTRAFNFIADLGTLSGYVTDSVMNPIEGARVRVYFHNTSRENYSDANGYFHVTDIPICYCIKNATCSKEGYNSAWVYLTIWENTTYNFVLTSKGNWLYVGGSGPGNYTKIQDAIDNATDGDTVFVYDDSAPYGENLMIEKSIHLLGEQKETTIIVGRYGIDDPLIHVQGGTGGTINGFSLISNTSISGIMAGDCLGLVISNNVLDHQASSGIDIQFCDNTIITNNIVYDKEVFGVFLRESDNCRIEHNIIQHCYGDRYDQGYGMYIDTVNECTFSNNTLLNNTRYGLYMQFSNHNLLIGNDFENNREHSLFLSNSKANQIIQNNFINNSDETFFSIAFFNRWDANYWGNPYVLKFIKGVFITNGIVPVPHIIFKIDWHPVQELYDVPGVR
jgi:parallel beta-helix repeat protein